MEVYHLIIPPRWEGSTDTKRRLCKWFNNSTTPVLLSGGEGWTEDNNPAPTTVFSRTDGVHNKGTRENKSGSALSADGAISIQVPGPQLAL